MLLPMGDRSGYLSVKQLASLAGVSTRTLHYYDEIGLLRPTQVAANGYRQYDRRAVLRLQQIRFYRELGLGLDPIRQILDHRVSIRCKHCRCTGRCCRRIPIGCACSLPR